MSSRATKKRQGGGTRKIGGKNDNVSSMATCRFAAVQSTIANY